MWEVGLPSVVLAGSAILKAGFPNGDAIRLGFPPGPGGTGKALPGHPLGTVLTTWPSPLARPPAAAIGSGAGPFRDPQRPSGFGRAIRNGTGRPARDLPPGQDAAVYFFAF